MNSIIRIFVLIVIVVWTILLTVYGHSETFDRSFKAVMAFQMTATLADGITTATWNRSKCDYEDFSPWLYGRDPSPTRIGLVMAGESLGSVALGYWLKRKNVHLGPVKLWSIPMMASGSGHLAGTIHNLRRCR